MTALNQNLSMVRGDTRTIRIRVTDKAGAPINLSGATARWWMGTSADRTKPVHVRKATGGQGLTIETEAEGGVTYYALVIVLAPADTAEVPPGTWFHEAEVTDASNNVGTVTQGSFTLRADLIPPA